jgi:hypothetical protein
MRANTQVRPYVPTPGVFEEDKAEDNVFVLGGIHVGAESVGGTPELRFKAESRTVVCIFCHVSSPFGIKIETKSYHVPQRMTHYATRRSGVKPD